MSLINDNDFLGLIAEVKQSGDGSSEPDPEIVVMLRQTFKELCSKGKFSEVVLRELEQLTSAQTVEAYERLLPILNKPS